MVKIDTGRTLSVDPNTAKNLYEALGEMLPSASTVSEKLSGRSRRCGVTRTVAAAAVASATDGTARAAATEAWRSAAVAAAVAADAAEAAELRAVEAAVADY